jgi:H+-transporting ATPase
VQVLFLAIGLIMTGHAILTPLLMVLIMITGDFLGMSLTTDNVRPSPDAECVAHRQSDDRRRHHGNRRAGLLHIRVLAFGAYRMGFDIARCRTLAFVVIVFGNQATTYTNRERRHLWSSRPSSGSSFRPSPIF